MGEAAVAVSRGAKLVLAAILAVLVVLGGALVLQSVTGSPVASWIAVALFFVAMAARWLLVSRQLPLHMRRRTRVSRRSRRRRPGVLLVV